jgi:hypothetical protein
LSGFVGQTQNSSGALADGSGVNPELSGFELTLKLAAGQDLEATNHMHVTHQLPFDLQAVGVNMSLNLGVGSYH